MIDFHSHILPKMDDGSRSVDESLELLRMLSEQGVDTVIATPHFYPDTDSLDEFLSRRAKTFETLKENITEELPKILIGAEVRYYPGISRLENSASLCIEGTKLMLLEMSETRWTEYTVRELVELANMGKIRLIIAHFERCMGYQSKDTIKRLYESGIMMQFNASFFLNRKTRRKALSMLKAGKVHLLGSDCHNITSRPPRISDAVTEIKKKFGEDFLLEFSRKEYTLI